MLILALIATLTAAFGVDAMHTHALAKLPMQPADVAARRTRLLFEAWLLSGTVLVAYAVSLPTLH